MTEQHSTSTDASTTPDAPVVVAIDGPAGSGKSSVSKAVARRLGYRYLDTGAWYRALALHTLDADVDPEDSAAVIGSLDAFGGAFTVSLDPDVTAFTLGARDVTDEIRGPRVTAVVSAVARVPEVRAWINETFRSLIADVDRPGIVVEGRDITTVVAPDAQARILLTASEAARMARRSAEFESHPAGDVAEQLQRRDRADSRVVDFMNAADGVTTVDSTHIDFDETVDAVVRVTESLTARNSHGSR
ncbi:(d)CMP kinase [Plantibacter sp. T3]|uniref:(d)CMP kinase n=1 Tax=Plantibacter sp. T3 TaxID=2653161 RepID=UPI0012F2CFBF|nr:(d)CMP kinase [Plantibacter sp. T3]VXC27141.1 Cytidylate kinase [Plantibacter sp. T3]